MVKAAENTFGTVDVLINNAGIALYKMFCDTTPSDWNHIFSVNVNGMVYVTQAVLPGMVHQKAGKIVNLSSMWGITGGSCEVAYSASKAAVIGFTKALAKELAPSNIQVNAIACGLIDTDMNRHLTPLELAAITAEIPADRAGTVKEVAELVLQTALSPVYMTGQIITIDGGWIS